MRTLNRAGPNTEPWGAPLVTTCQLDETPFTTILLACPKSTLAGPDPLTLLHVLDTQDDLLYSNTKVGLTGW